MLQSNKAGVVKWYEECDLAFEALTCKNDTNETRVIKSHNPFHAEYRFILSFSKH